MTKLGIVLVEDDAILCDLLKLRLSKMGYTVRGAYPSGEEAVHSIPEEHPDLVLMDINLSGQMDGIETAHHIQKRNSIPVVYLTSSNDSKTFERAKITDECEYVVKPFSDQDLYIAIELAYHKFTLHRMIKNKQKFLEKLVRNLDDSIISTDSEGFITMMNPAAEALIDNQFKSVRKMHFRELVSIVDETGRIMENPIDRIKLEMDPMDLPDNATLVSTSGEKIPVKGSISPIKDDKGNFGGIVLSISPVSRPKVLRYTGKRKF